MDAHSLKGKPQPTYSPKSCLATALLVSSQSSICLFDSTGAPNPGGVNSRPLTVARRSIKSPVEGEEGERRG